MYRKSRKDVDLFRIFLSQKKRWNIRVATRESPRSREPKRNAVRQNNRNDVVREKENATTQFARNKRNDTVHEKRNNTTSSREQKRNDVVHETKTQRRPREKKNQRRSSLEPKRKTKRDNAVREKQNATTHFAKNKTKQRHCVGFSRTAFCFANSSWCGFACVLGRGTDAERTEPHLRYCRTDCYTTDLLAR